MIQFWTFSKIVNLQTRQSNDDLRAKLEGWEERDWTGVYTESLYKLLYKSSEVAKLYGVGLLNHNYCISTEPQHGMKKL